MKTETPVCDCHDEPMNRDRRGWWFCAVKRRERERRYYEANPEKVREQRRRYREANPEKKRESDHRYYEANREKRRESFCLWREANREKVREYGRRWSEANPEKVREYGRRWFENNRHQRRYQYHGITREDALALYESQGKRCAGCLEPFPFDVLEVDHDHECCEKCEGRWSCGESVRGLLCHPCNAKDVLATRAVS